VVGGDIVAAADEDRFSRRKHGKPDFEIEADPGDLDSRRPTLPAWRVWRVWRARP
jgi:hypothetical protein